MLGDEKGGLLLLEEVVGGPADPDVVGLLRETDDVAGT